MITVENMTKIYNKGEDSQFYALKWINFSVEKGEMVAIIGKSGAGKSTLLHILGGIDEYDSGRYEVDGLDVGALDANGLANFRNKKVGIILQDFALIEKCSAIDNVMIPLRFSKTKHREFKGLAKKALEQVGMEEYAAKEVSKLSGGQKQRVAIARALVNDPDFILADEPTGALDTETTKQIMDVLKGLNKSGKTVIIVTHDPEVAKACERVIEISDGKIV